MKEINLTKGYKTQVSDEDYEYLTQNFKKFQYVKNHNSCYAKTTKVINGKLEHLKLHRLIYNRCSVVPTGREIDHIDKNPLNNQRNNLRAVTHKENCNNRNVVKSVFCGVCETNLRYKNYYYCRSCWNKYQKEYRRKKVV